MKFNLLVKFNQKNVQQKNSSLGGEMLMAEMFTIKNMFSYFMKVYDGMEIKVGCCLDINFCLLEK